MVQKAFRIVSLGILVLVLAMPALAQNTKGDRPSPPSRETRFKTPRKAPKKKKTKQGRRVKRKSARPTQGIGLPPAQSRRAGERPARPSQPTFRRPQPSGKQRAWTGDTGRPRVRPRPASSRARNVYPQPGTTNYSSQRPKRGRPLQPTFQSHRPSKKQKAWTGDITGRRIRPPEAGRRARNVYPQPGTTNYSSRTLKRSPRNNENPNLRRVRRILQQHERAKARPGRPIRPVYVNKHPRHKEKAWTGDITGRRIRAGASRPPQERAPAVSQGTARPKTGRVGAMAGHPQSQARNYTRRRFYVNNQSQRPQAYGARRTRALMMLSRSGPRTPQEVRGKRIFPRSASAAYLSRRSINVWAHFPRRKRKQERAITTDLAGRKLRTKNFESRHPILANPSLNYQRRRASGEKAYRGGAGGYATRPPGQRAWRGDIAHWPLRAGKAPGGRAKPGRMVPGKAPGIGALGIAKFRGRIRRQGGLAPQGEGYSGNIRTRRPPKGGGSVSGPWNNNGVPIQGKTPGRGSSGIGYSGNIRAGRRALNDQGEEYTGNIRRNRRRGFNDQGEEYSGNIRRGRRGFTYQGETYRGNIRSRRGFNDQGEEYTGNIKTRRPEKGGGSATQGWNNNNRPISVRVPRGQTDIARYRGNLKGQRQLQDQGEEYTGNIKTRRPEKGGGSVSGRVWNNHNTPIPVRTPQGQAQMARYQGNIKAGRRQFQDQGEEYTGNIKARRPEKGGGSVSGKVWNNNNTPIAVRPPRAQTQIDRYRGNIKASQRQFQDQGEEYTGNIKVRGGTYQHNPNAAAEALRVRREKNEQGGDFAGNIKLSRNRYTRNPNAAKGALPVYRERHQQGFDFAGHMKLARNSYGRSPGAASNALPTQKPTTATAQAASYSGRTRQSWNYVRNPSAAAGALRIREPGRAFARATDYQGSIKLKRFALFGNSELHPDAQFVKLNKNNVAGERDVLTNLKLWWARLFRRNETQPDHLKEKEHKPRYDKGEAGMWYE